MPHTLNRVVKVDVDVSVSPTDGAVTITCTPNSADVVKDTKHALLTFTLKTTGWRFPVDDAIIIDPQQLAPEDAKTNFPYSSWTISDTSAAMYDNNKTAKTFGYTVTVVNNSTGKSSSIDPEVNNGGGGLGSDGC
jgi:hypothetical protein